MTAPIEYLEIGIGDRSKRKFILDRDSIDIGRSSESLLHLDNLNVSRRHAYLVKTGNLYTITDLDSASGTWVNDAKLKPHLPQLLKPGDLIRIADIQIRVCSADEATSPTPPGSPKLAATVLADDLSTGQTLAVPLPISPVLQVSTPQGTKRFHLVQNSLSIGRDPSSDIAIDSEVVSVQHALIRRYEDGYEIVDTDSKNGITLGGRRIRQKKLEDGDVLYIGGNITLTYSLIAFGQVSAPMRLLDLRGRNSWSFGRDPQNDSVIDHPSVSRNHSRIERQNGALVITDLSSTNGTFVNGKQIAKAHTLRIADSIRIGPYRFVININETIASYNEEGNLRLDAIHLNKITSKGTTLLNDVSLSILAKEFVVIAGVSGGGKSTLLDALNGFRPATSGSVLVNGNDLYKNFNAYRTELGYVPQKDIVHMELSVQQALDYAAQLRMPADTTPSERRTRINEVLEDLGLSDRRHLPIKDLSGGQLKRVSIGVELITKPSLFFLDEATSGLDPGTEAEIMQLLRQLADRGRTVLLITHTTENVALCDLVIFLAAGGHIAYFGPPSEALTYFGVTKFNEIYSKVERELSPQEWQKRYQKSPQYQKYVVERQQNIKVPANSKRPRIRKQTLAANIKHVSAWRQFMILSHRNIVILMRDRASLILMLAIAPILGLMDFVTWKRELFDIEKGNPNQVLTMLFAMALVAVMVGSLATMREIVKEVDVYRRERAIGLQSFPYVLSKIFFCLPIAAYQAAIFLLFKHLAIDLPGDLASMYVTLFLGTFAGTIMGLLTSAISPNQNIAPLLMIILLVPQIIFGGGLLPVADLGVPAQTINLVSLTKWPFEAMVTITGFGTSVAEDPCWQKTESERKNLTDDEKTNTCHCFGPQIYDKCQFPGLKADYDKASLTAIEPVKPKPPKDPFDATAKKDFDKRLDRYTKDYGKWKGDREGAIKGAETLISRFQKNNGSMFAVDVQNHWSVLGGLMAAMVVIILLAQKLKDTL
jgi:ABC-type multidrug transport system ATPase subunit/pSer/pThr/pTyr-binding forkhead associated (FHA) protein